MTATTRTTRTVELSDRELEVLVNALEIMRSDFGHDQADVLQEVRALAAKLTAEAGDRGAETR